MIDLYNPAHIFVIFLVFIAWGIWNWTFDSWFDTNRFFPECLYVALWAALVLGWIASLVITIMRQWNP